MLGKIRNCSLDKSTFKINFDNGDLYVEFISFQMVRIFQNRKRPSFAVINNKIVGGQDLSFNFKGKKVELTNGNLLLYVFNNGLIKLFTKDGKIVIESKDDIIDLDKQNASDEIENLKFVSTFLSHENEAFFGLGDKAGPLNKRNYEFANWNSDIPQAHVETMKSLYKSIPFFVGIHDSSTYGVFLDNTYRSVFNFLNKDNESFYFGASGGELDYYIMVGDNIKSIVRLFSSLIGTYPLPQIWTLGNQQSRWSYWCENEAQGIVDSYKKYKIPLDVIHLDIDYMDGYRVFTTSEKRFPKIKEWISSLSSDGIKVVTIIDPGVKVDESYSVYQKGIANNHFAKLGKDIYVNQVWPGDSVFPTFSSKDTRLWWGDNLDYLISIGVSGIWNDMNEPASFKGPLPYNVTFKSDNGLIRHDEIHNVYGHLMAEATYDRLFKTGKRPFIITRSCFAGTNRYSTVWTGDNQSIWDHLRLAIPQQISLGISGVSFVGTDIGGFGGDATPELMSRWIEVGCFSPLMRNHSAFNSKRQEPWMFDKLTLDIYRKYVNLRYKLIPYMYDLFHIEEIYGDPLIRSIFYNFPEEKSFFNNNDEFMLGENLLISPVVTSGSVTKLVALPKGKWFDYWTNEIVEGEYIIKKAPLDVCPIFVKSGAIIPNFVDGLQRVSSQDKIIFDIYQGKGKYVHYQDDGETFDYRKGIFNQYEIVLDDDKIQIELIKNGYEKLYKEIEIHYHCDSGLSQFKIDKFELNKKIFVKL